MLIKTEKGLEVEINKEAFDDMRVVDALADMQKGDVFAVSTLTSLVMDKENKKKIYDFVMDENGRIPTAKFGEVFNEIMSLMGEELKNSQS